MLGYSVKNKVISFTKQQLSLSFKNKVITFTKQQSLQHVNAQLVCCK